MPLRGPEVERDRGQRPGRGNRTAVASGWIYGTSVLMGSIEEDVKYPEAGLQ